MRAEIVHVTDHALLRWRERAARHANEGADEIIQAVKQSKVLKKKELLPYPMPRLPNSVYSVKDEILFVLESVTITEYRLVTVITHDGGTARTNPKVKRRKTPSLRYSSDKVKIEHRRLVEGKIKKALLEDSQDEAERKCSTHRKKQVASRQRQEDREVILAFKPRPICYQPPIILTDGEKSLVRDTMMEVAQNLGLVVNL